MHLGPQQGLGIVLARDLQAAGEQLRQHRHRHQLPRDLGAAPALTREGARDDQLVVLDRQAPLVELRLELGQIRGAEDRLDRGAPAALPRRARGRATSREQRQRAQHDRLARSRLAGEHVQPGPELELGALDDREVGDAQRLDQRAPQRSFLRITSKRLRPGGTSSLAGFGERRTVTRSPSSSDRPT